MKLKDALAIAILLASSTLVQAPTQIFAGVWSAGGGEVTTYTSNPWFLENTKTVHYCVRQETEDFSLPSSKASQRIRSAFDYWVKEFKGAHHNSIQGKIVIGNQKFVEISCLGSLEQALEQTDIVIQLGELNEEQITFLQDPRRFVAVTVLTEFSFKNLRGKGFIYVSPDIGARRYDKQSLLEGAWSHQDGDLFERVIVHEIGHVFGLQHRGRTALNEIMSAGYPELILQRQVAAVIPPLKKLPHFNVLSIPREVDPEKNSGHCRLSDQGRRFYDPPATTQCLRFSIGNEEIEVYAKSSSGDQGELIGSIVWDKSAHQEFEPLIRIGITSEQNVFQGISRLYDIGFVNGSASNRIVAPGTYKSKSGKVERTARVELTIRGFSIDGYLDGKLLLNIK